MHFEGICSLKKELHYPFDTYIHKQMTWVIMAAGINNNFVLLHVLIPYTCNILQWWYKTHNECFSFVQ